MAAGIVAEPQGEREYVHAKALFLFDVCDVPAAPSITPGRPRDIHLPRTLEADNAVFNIQCTHTATNQSGRIISSHPLTVENLHVPHPRPGRDSNRTWATRTRGSCRRRRQRARRRRFRGCPPALWYRRTGGLSCWIIPDPCTAAPSDDSKEHGNCYTRRRA
ncbi:hypothetical protein BC834DRAFT_856084 [Gloeopeniophorella convolvens]|nr:hypothetical protein BC834DRAFT_856084 [Gloeopeniophorella convolvens]